MNKLLYLLLFLMFIGTKANGQDNYIDNFYKYIHNQQYEEAIALSGQENELTLNDSVATEYYYILGRLYYQSQNFDSAYLCFNNSTQAAEKIGKYDSIYVDAMSIMIDYDSQRYYDSQVVKLARRLCKKEISLIYCIPRVYEAWIMSLSTLKRYNEAISICDKALTLFENDINCKDNLWRFIYYKSTIYAEMQDFQLSDSLFLVAKKMIQSSDNLEAIDFLPQLRSHLQNIMDYPYKKKYDLGNLFIAAAFGLFTQDIFEALYQYFTTVPFDFSDKKDYNHWKMNQLLLNSYYYWAKDTITNSEELLYNITLATKNSLDIQIGKRYPVLCKWTDVQEYLLDDELAVEFSLLGNEILVLRKDTKQPISFTLDSLLVNQIEDAILDENYDFLYSQELSPLSKLWHLLDPYLQGIKTVYLAPSNIYNRINYEAIFLGDGKRVKDFYEIRRLISTSDIREAKSRNRYKYHSASIFGGINYDASIEEIINEAQLYDHTSSEEWTLTRGMSENERGGTFSYLAGTETEGLEINKLFNSQEIKTSCYYGTKATEESIKKTSDYSPDIIHIATHGFVLLSNQMKEHQHLKPFVLDTLQYTGYESTMSRSGLVFSGGNQVWQGNPSIPNVEDGILTSKEIAGLDLSNTKLVVLSACESGLGDTSNFSGTVWGIQHAFRLAGVDYIVASLWRVDDTATSLLMTTFYKNLLNGEEIHVALRHAKEHLQTNGFDDPYYWAAFYILD